MTLPEERIHDGRDQLIIAPSKLGRGAGIL
jgi:hypothetical protein